MLVLPVAIGCVPHQGEAEKLEMNPDLVRPSGVQQGLGQSRLAQAFYALFLVFWLRSIRHREIIASRNYATLYVPRKTMAAWSIQAA